ncbi:MAG: PCRF domain-containing protein [Clostridia bacterium]|nr:PCRF domain-containing protein [Clostridia bacterium]
MFKADDYRLKIQGMRGVLAEAGYALDIENLRPRLAELEKEQENPDVWQDLEKSTKIGREVSMLRNKINAYEEGETALNDAADIVDLIEETGDESLIAELDEMLAAPSHLPAGRS